MSEIRANPYIIEEACVGLQKEIDILHGKTDCISNQITENIKELNNKYENINDKHDRLDSKNRGQIQALLQCQTQLQELQEIVGKCKACLKDDDATLKHLLQTRKSHGDRINEISSKLEEVASQHSYIIGTIKILENRNDHQEDKTADESNDCERDRASNLARQNSARQSMRMVLQINNDVQSNTDELELMRNEINCLKTDNKHKDETIQRLEAQNQDLLAKFDTISCISKEDAVELVEFARSYSERKKQKRKMSWMRRKVLSCIYGNDTVDIYFV